MSAMGGQADIGPVSRYTRFAPIADAPEAPRRCRKRDVGLGSLTMMSFIRCAEKRTSERLPGFPGSNMLLWPAINQLEVVTYQCPSSSDRVIRTDLHRPRVISHVVASGAPARRRRDSPDGYPALKFSGTAGEGCSL